MTVTVHSPIVTYASMLSLLSLCPPFVILLMELWSIFFYGAFEAALQLLLPGKRVEGPVTPTGNQPFYKDNGLAAYFVTLATYLGLWWYGIFNPAIVYDHLGEIFSALIFGSFIFYVLLYVKGHAAPSSSDSGSCGNLIINFYWASYFCYSYYHSSKIYDLDLLEELTSC